MTAQARVNPLTGREKDVLSMCERFLEDDRIKDHPEVYHKKLAILELTVILLKHLYDDELDLKHLISFLTDSKVMDKDLQTIESMGSIGDRQTVQWFKCHFIDRNDEFRQITAELSEELCKLPH